MSKCYEVFCLAWQGAAARDNGFLAAAGGVYASPEVQSLAQYPQHARIDRLRHVTGVAYLSYRLARRLGWHVEETTRAAVLHDLYYYDWHERDRSHWPHGHRHPGFALKNARLLCNGARYPRLSPREENLIKRHMWPFTPTPPVYKEGLIVLFADKYCAALECLIGALPQLFPQFQPSKE
jgi:uncharacterized protein